MLLGFMWQRMGSWIMARLPDHGGTIEFKEQSYRPHLVHSYDTGHRSEGLFKPGIPQSLPHICDILTEGLFYVVVHLHTSTEPQPKFALGWVWNTTAISVRCPVFIAGMPSPTS